MVPKWLLKKYKVTLTRLVEEESCIWIDAEDEADARAQALSGAEYVADLIWGRTTMRPHNYQVERVTDDRQ
jgi:hypothetical protein